MIYKILFFIFIDVYNRITSYWKTHSVIIEENLYFYIRGKKYYYQEISMQTYNAWKYDTDAGFMIERQGKLHFYYLHRDNGPASEGKFYLNGKRIHCASTKEFKSYVKLQKLWQ